MREKFPGLFQPANALLGLAAHLVEFLYAMSWLVRHREFAIPKFALDMIVRLGDADDIRCLTSVIVVNDQREAALFHLRYYPVLNRRRVPFDPL